jgi:hypothetical protein
MRYLSVSSRALVALVSSSALLVACGGDGDGATGQRTPVAAVVFDPDTLVIEVGQSVAVRAILLGDRGSAISGPPVAYTATGAGLTIDGLGILRATTVGMGQVTATADGRQGTLVVQVIPVIGQLRILPTSLTLDVGESADYIVELLDTQFRRITAPGVRLNWTVETPAIATVSNAGRVNAVSAGVTTATAKVGLHTAVVGIRVFTSTAVSRITATQPRYGMLVGQSRVLRATVYDSAGVPLTRIPIWTSISGLGLQVAADGGATALYAGSFLAEARMGTQFARTEVTIFDSVRTDALGAAITDDEFVTIGAGSLTRRIGEATAALTVTAPYRIQRSEVTQSQWLAVGVPLPPGQSRDCARCPVEHVTVEAANQFLTALNALQPGRNYRLPTAAQWEFAARAGETEADYHDDPELTSWSVATRSFEGPSRVALRQPNVFGLYDVHGNVAELTSTPMPGSAGTRAGGAWNTAIFTHAFVWIGPPSSPVTGVRLVRDP